MFRLATDENFNNMILRGLLNRLSNLDVVRIQDTEMSGQDDPQVLEWTAIDNRILLTHDFETMIGFAQQRIEARLPMPGLFVMRNSTQPGKLIDELATIILCSQPQEWEDRVTFLPL